MKQVKLEDLRILLVEPSATQYHVIKGYLEDFGVRNIAREKSGGDALASSQRSRPDLVISAMYLPDMTGTDLVYKIREIGALMDLPFMLISSETSLTALDPIRQAGVVAILPKPFEPVQLKKALFTTLDFLQSEEIDLGETFAEELRVLIVDDSRTARRYIRNMLQGFGITLITEAQNGREAVELIDTNSYDLIVTDYNMPLMTGNELVAHIRHKSRQPSVPIIMVTGESDLSRLAAVDHTGVSALYDKPFEPANVRELIRTMFG